MSGQRPPKPDNVDVLGLTDSLWEIIQRSWEEDPDSRPSLSEILVVLEDAAEEVASRTGSNVQYDGTQEELDQPVSNTIHFDIHEMSGEQ